MKSKKLDTTLTLVALLIALTCGVLFTNTASAATAEISSEESPNRIYELRAKVAYLTAFVDALRDGERSPAPTYLVTVKGSMVSAIGTVARDPQPDMMEICGPMNKGMVNWGDGTHTPLLGLGCSGDAHTFAVGHKYEESGSYKIVVTDLADRTKKHVVAVKVE